MKNRIGKTISVFAILLVILTMDGCKKEAEPQLVGKPGNPRFNLQFDNETNVDLDLHVTDPKGETIYWRNTSSRSGGELDVDCLCDDCSQGPNENIFWPEDDSAPKGTYKFWVNYYDYCRNPNQTSHYTVRVTMNRKIMDTYEGSLSSGKSQVWTFIKN